MADLIDYPEQLPPPGLSGYELQTVPPFVRTEMDSGRARQRRRFTSVPTIVPVQWLFTSGEFALFEGWFRYQIDDGAAWFAGPLKTSQGIRHDYDQRFTSMYRAAARGPRYWMVDAEIEIRERQTIAKDWILYAPDYVARASLLDIALNREWPAA